MMKVAYEARTSNIRRRNNWGRQTTRRGAIHTSFQEGSFLADRKPVTPINDLTWFHNPVFLTDTTCPSRRKYNLGDRRHHHLNETEWRKAVAYDSFINKTIRMNTTRLYNVPIPYAHLQVVRATRNPKTNGERWGAKTTPILHILIYDNTIDSWVNSWKNSDIPSWLANEMGRDQWWCTDPNDSNASVMKLCQAKILTVTVGQELWLFANQSLLSTFATVSLKHTRRNQWDTALLYRIRVSSDSEDGKK